MPFGKTPLPVVWGEIVTEPKSMCPTHSEAKQYQNIRVWSREEFTAEPHKEMGGSCLKKLWNFLKVFHKALLQAR